ncbi:MAG: mechanosensitive ion channel [Fusobacterium sp.]|nr:mechanosensitive ion channel [Fusobacterium sp.]
MEDISKYFTTNYILNYIELNIIKLLPAIVLILLYKKIVKSILKILNKSYSKIFSNVGVVSFLNSASKFLVNFILVIIILNLLGIPVHRFTAIISAFSLVFGFAFKDVLGNIFGGIIILLVKPFKVDDFINYSGHEGRVKKIELFYTSVINYNNDEILIPNGAIINSEVKNITSDSDRRLDIRVGVGYGSNIDEVKETIMKILEKRKEDLFKIEKYPPMVGMYEIGASSLDFDIKVYVAAENYVLARYYLNESIKTEFDAKGIELPFNIIDLQVNPNFNKLNLENNK